jgi:hypothetical protein
MNCPECGVAPTELHQLGCGWEQCPYCGEHLADCDCLPSLDDRLAWMGNCSWLGACIEFGFFEKEIDGRWIPCRDDDPESQPDISRLMRKCCWNRVKKRYELQR